MALTEVQRFTSTYGANTNVSTTSISINRAEITDNEWKSLLAYASRAPGDISIDPRIGIVSIKSQKALEVFREIVPGGDKLMQLSGADRKTLTEEGRLSGMAFVRRYAGDKKGKLSFADLVMYINCLIFSVMAEQRRALAQAKSSSTMIMSNLAALNFFHSLQTAIKEFEGKKFEMWARIGGAIGNFAVNVGGTIASTILLHGKKEQLEKNKLKIERGELVDTKQKIKDLNEEIVENNKKIGKLKEANAGQSAAGGVVTAPSQEQINQNEEKIKELEAQNAEKQRDLEVEEAAFETAGGEKRIEEIKAKGIDGANYKERAVLAH